MFTPIDTTLLFTKNDPADLRLGDLTQTTASSSAFSIEDSFAILGYPDDEGIRLNGGRPGAALAPNNIRRVLYKMTPAYDYNKKNPLITDYGNCVESHSTLDERHQIVEALVTELHAKKQKIISFGGGHDYGYPDGAAFCEKYISQNVKPLIINFDAHLDVRSNHQANHSGTPFYRLKQKFKDRFHLIEIGLQPQCNSRSHWQWALENNIDLIPLDLIESTKWDCLWKNNYISRLTPQTPVFISFDMDAVCSGDAGGCSQAWPTGLKLNECLSFLKKLYSVSNTRGLGIYEVSPPYDFDFKTAKAAALLTYQYIFS